jgi:hypothetical protein
VRGQVAGEVSDGFGDHGDDAAPGSRHPGTGDPGHRPPRASATRRRGAVKTTFGSFATGRVVNGDSLGYGTSFGALALGGAASAPFLGLAGNGASALTRETRWGDPRPRTPTTPPASSDKPRPGTRLARAVRRTTGTRTNTPVDYRAG